MVKDTSFCVFTSMNNNINNILCFVVLVVNALYGKVELKIERKMQ